jgi:prephenate dehydratase
MDQPRIAFQGELGAFSNEAAKRMLGEQIKLIPCRTFDDMFAAVESGEADNCLAPIRKWSIIKDVMLGPRCKPVGPNG